jgi:hypothetical protein
MLGNKPGFELCKMKFRYKNGKKEKKSERIKERKNRQSLLKHHEEKAM